MKRFLFLIGFMGAFLVSATADDYAFPYLVFTNSDGSKKAVAVEQLEITFVDGQLVAVNNEGDQRIPLTTLSSMQFSEDKESVADGITSVEMTSDIESVFDLSGRRTSRATDKSLRRGTYIIRKADGSTSKIIVK